MLDLDFYATFMQQEREATVYRRADALGPGDREEELARRALRPARRRLVPVFLAGACLTALGRRLTALGEHLAPEYRDHTQPTA